MSRNYTLVTIKTLFGEASQCAYPECGQPLIFADRGRKTAIAEIAHIRSEAPGGPRHDPDFAEDVDGPDNLLLLCGVHHKPVDRHESIYSVAELEGWKAVQRSSAGVGTALSDTDLRSYIALTPEDRKVLADIARLAQRVIGLAKSAQQEILGLRAGHEKARLAAWAQTMAGAYGVDDDGNKHLLGSEGYALSMMEQREQSAQVASAWEPHRLRIVEALAALDEEIAVLRMTFVGGVISDIGDLIVSAAQGIPVEDEPGLVSAVDRLRGLVVQLWRVANGEVDPASTPSGT